MVMVSGEMDDKLIAKIQKIEKKLFVLNPLQLWKTSDPVQIRKKFK